MACEAHESFQIEKGFASDAEIPSSGSLELLQSPSEAHQTAKDGPAN